MHLLNLNLLSTISKVACPSSCIPCHVVEMLQSIHGRLVLPTFSHNASALSRRKPLAMCIVGLFSLSCQTSFLLSSSHLQCCCSNCVFITWKRWQPIPSTPLHSRSMTHAPCPGSGHQINCNRFRKRIIKTHLHRAAICKKFKLDGGELSLSRRNCCQVQCLGEEERA